MLFRSPRQDLAYTEAENCHGMAAAELHEPHRRFGGVPYARDQAFAGLTIAELGDESHS